MDQIVKEVLERIEAEMKRQKITKKILAKKLGKTEAWAHSVFSLRRQLKASDFLRMLALLKLPCEKVLPQKIGTIIGTLDFNEYLSRLIGREIQSYMKRQVSTSKGKSKKRRDLIPDI